MLFYAEIHRTILQWVIAYCKERFTQLFNERTNERMNSFICRFNDAFSATKTITSNERVIVNDKLERIWKVAVVA
jgi:hypothetical protein